MKILNEDERIMYANNDDFDGILVLEPKPDKVLDYCAELYIYGTFVNTDNEREIHLVMYNQEDGGIDGFTVSRKPVGPFASILENDFNAYKFDDLEDFSRWYLNKRLKNETNKCAKHTYNNSNEAQTIVISASNNYDLNNEILKYERLGYRVVDTKMAVVDRYTCFISVTLQKRVEMK